VAGETSSDALPRVRWLTGGELARDIYEALSQTRSGAPITRALTTLIGRRWSHSRDSCMNWLSRSSAAPPMADVLRADPTSGSQ
jgi:hypothetical protein